MNSGRLAPLSADTGSSGSDQVKLQYNVDGSTKKRTDQRGTVIEFTYNGRRQLELDRVTTLGGSDSHVKSIKREYDTLARLEKVASYENDDGTGQVRNQVVLAHNQFSQVTTSWQSHDGAATITGSPQSPKVQYSYDATVNGSAVFTNGHRHKDTTYPSGRVIYKDYNTADSINDLLHRVRRIRETDSNGTNLVEYLYNGIGRQIGAGYVVISLGLTYYPGSGSAYTGLDRYGRVKDQFWNVWTSSTDVDRFKYEYDYAGNPKYRDIDSAIYATNDKDQAYTFDGLHRLATYDKGTLSGTTISGTPAKEQDWTLDDLGNWGTYVEKAAGATTLNQSRTNNKVNEITGVSASTGDDWYDPTFDAAGNMRTER